jgi:tetratricopeptide (TPR) repeat protein
MISDGQPQPVMLTVRSLLARSVLTVCLLAVVVAIAWASVIEPVRADWWERRARVSDSRGDHQGAVTAAEKALAIDPLRLETRYFLAGLFANDPGEEQHRRAIQECLRIEELAPDYADITYNLGQLFLSQRQTGAALPFLQRAVQLNPYNADKRIRLGIALDQLGDVLAAREQWEAALQMRPGDPAIKTLLAHDQPSIQP